MRDGAPISDKIRGELKSPVGQIVADGLVTKALLAEYFGGNKLTVCVGDRTTERIHEFGFSPDLEIVDSLEKRKPRQPPMLTASESRIVLKAINPPGLISGDSMEKLAKSLSLIKGSHEKVRLEVKGEEDLLALPVVAFFPEGTVVMYGQPNVGLVIVSSKESRERSEKILQEMGISSLPVP
jgi:GTP-dependent dephospho-CoA kinase